MRPLVGSTSRLIIFIVVVLPDPDGPTRAHTSPSAISRSSSCTAVWPFGHRLVTPSSRITPTTVGFRGDGPGFVAAVGRLVVGRRSPGPDPRPAARAHRADGRGGGHRHRARDPAHGRLAPVARP